MELWHDRVLNGVLKSGVIDDLEEARRRLSADVELIADPERVRTDLWSSVWAAAATLSRQFSGKIFIRCGLESALPAPAPLSPRCEFTDRPRATSIKLGIGIPVAEGPGNVWGDVRGGTLSYGVRLDQADLAHPISAFALAGYLSYAALARAVRLPPYRYDYTGEQLTMPIPTAGSLDISTRGITCIGLGQLGQAYLALLFFLATKSRPGNLILVDKDAFELPNRSTQILLPPTEEWVGEAKASFLAAKLRDQGWNAEGEVTELTWDWRRPKHHPPLVLLGLDNLDVRRMAVGAGYEWIIESGVGTSFLEPRVSWHSLPADARLARKLFSSSGVKVNHVDQEMSLIAKQLKSTPGECGWVTFNNIRATAPSMGIVASAYAWCSLLAVLQGEGRQTQGRACLWSPLLPYLQEPVSP